MEPKEAAFRKRSQIVKANRTMFVWVAVVSAILGVALVGSIFLVQKIIFNEKVLAQKAQTVDMLKTDNANVADLEAQVRVLNTNQALASAQTSSDEQPVQVILDALPSDANSLALGASLQDKLLSGVPGLTLVSLQVDPVVGIESLGTDATDQASSVEANSSQPQITFTFSVSGDETALQTALQNLERSIRTIDIISLKIESQGTTRLMTVQAAAFYQPARVVQLVDKVVK